LAKGHLLQGSEEDWFSLGDGLLGSAVHADFEFVHFRAHAQHAQTFTDGFEFRWQ
jgi:hypothetical protein